ncbi:hypothetical protein SZN_17292 [Streptomyces zinciresistens K42]|uniref:Uncharacterized protein n=1 Tax=Streptomyces zinciresistens K42 TaxID=700597 RepID=G2GD81_9ACTN|nr:hypothetical protein [Streptomyces zinciresistens]EGX58542.1 hypothetical protein SZN_17292 [Streptomyces zinciresistens K42]
MVEESGDVSDAVPRISRGIEVYGGSDGAVSWSGVELTADSMRELGAGPWAERVGDLAATREFLAGLRSLAATDMETEFISTLLEAEPEPLPWQVGEALAEVLLEHWHGALWVWDGARDRRTRKASLPGADLVGLCVADGSARLLFGEVKSSSQVDCPPSVMVGAKGMIEQLKRLSGKDDHLTLMKWLNVRCRTPEHKAAYRGAVNRWVKSQGKDIQLFGCLVRDTTPQEKDLGGRAAHLAKTVVEPMHALLTAWYLPVAMTTWPQHVGVRDLG